MQLQQVQLYSILAQAQRKPLQKELKVVPALYRAI